MISRRRCVGLVVTLLLIHLVLALTWETYAVFAVGPAVIVLIVITGSVSELPGDDYGLGRAATLVPAALALECIVFLVAGLLVCRIATSRGER